MGIKTYLTEGVALANVRMKRKLSAKWNDYPFGRQPKAPRERYLELFESARNESYPTVDEIEQEIGYAVDRAWLDDLALHTQVTIKSYKGSSVAYPHGRLLYSTLRKYIADSGEKYIQIVETGTARGFSSLCMAKAIVDAGADGRIFTIDLLPHAIPMYWNCIDDHEGAKSRSQLLEPWRDLERKIVFLQGNTIELLPALGIDRVNFAFLDARHTAPSVLAEFETVESRQKKGDVIFFDDVTPAVFPGVVKAVDTIEQQGRYAFRRTAIGERRGYAWGPKVR